MANRINMKAGEWAGDQCTVATATVMPQDQFWDIRFYLSYYSRGERLQYGTALNSRYSKDGSRFVAKQSEVDSG